MIEIAVGKQNKPTRHDTVGVIALLCCRAELYDVLVNVECNLV